MSTKQRYANVWDAIENTPAEAENMKLRALLMRALTDHINIVPTERNLQPELSCNVYHTARMRTSAPKRALRIAVLSRAMTARRSNRSKALRDVRSRRSKPPAGTAALARGRRHRSGIR